MKKSNYYAIESEAIDMNDKPVLSVKELADYLGIGLSKAYDLIRQNVLPYRRIGKRILISKVVVDKWLTCDYARNI